MRSLLLAAAFAATAAVAQERPSSVSTQLNVTGEVQRSLARDGAPLRDGEGRFALVSLADEKFGPRHVKWLSRIEVRQVQ